MERMEAWDDPDAVVTECGRCGNVRPCMRLTDPFIEEVWPEDLGREHTHWWCFPCYDERRDDV